MKENKIEEYEITSLSDKGHGQGKSIHDTSSEQITIPSSIPGERVNGYRYKKGRKFQVRVTEVIEPSKHRQAPFCKHFEECGGCSLQHVSYEHQLELKQDRVKQLFHEHSTVAVEPIISSPKQKGYRNKMEFSFAKDKNGNILCGLFKKHFSFSVLSLEECHLVPDFYLTFIEAAKKWAQDEDISVFIPRKNRGTLRTLTIRHTSHTKQALLMLTVSGHPDDKLNVNQQQSLVNYIKEASQDLDLEISLQLRIQQAIAGKPTQMFEMTLDGKDQLFDEIQVSLFDQKITIPVQIGAQSFFQPNHSTYEILYQTAVEMAKVEPDDTVLDLYCGSGVFGLLSAHRAKQVFGADISQESIFDANENAKALGFDHAKFYCKDAQKMLEFLEQEGVSKIDILFIDPPRAGLGESVCKLIARFNPRKIIYISCNPATQIVDVNQLLNYNYDLAMLQPVDQFPHTNHIENIAVLNQRGV